MNFKLIITVIVLPIFSVFHSCSSIPLEPDSMVESADAVVDVPGSFDAGLAPVPEVASGLLSLFSDSDLKGYVREALRSNPDLQVSLARMEEAGFNTRKSYAPGMLSVNGGGSLGRSRSNGRNTGIYSALLDVQWELDVWGRLRSGVNAVKSDQAAIAADHEAARQSIAAQTMQAYFSLVASERLLALSERRLKSFEKSVSLVNRRFEAGTGSLSDLDLSRTDVENTKAQVEQRKDARDQAARLLSSLTGRYPRAGLRVKNFPSLSRGVAAGIPSDVMMRRPDIHSAYARILAADARMRVAHRDLYPRFQLTASHGQRSNLLRDIVKGEFNVWSVAGNLTAPLVDGGSRRSELGAANARAKQALGNYRAVVLGAFREVEDALGSERYLKSQEESYEKALKAARSAELRTRANYESGLVEILTLLDAQRRSFTTEESLINTEALRFQNRVRLALALGKGL